MGRKKLEINVNETQLQALYDNLTDGAPLQLALSISRISLASYYYWVIMASVSKYCKTKQELLTLKRLTESDTSVSEIMETSLIPTKKTVIGAYVEPTELNIKQYWNYKAFRRFCDECAEIINKCDECRSEYAKNLIVDMKKKSTFKGYKPQGAMWWLERNMPDLFAKANEKVIEDNEEMPVESIKVTYIDSNTDIQKDRIERLTNEILKGKGGEA